MDLNNATNTTTSTTTPYVVLDSTTTTQSSTNGTGNSQSPGWLGLDSTQILIIFLIVVFGVLIIFLLIYYYVIKGMRHNAQERLARSASGSIGEEKARNIFANPERQLAVDQSTRANPNSPASSTDADGVAQPIGQTDNNIINSPLPVNTGNQQQQPVALQPTNLSKSVARQLARKTTAQPTELGGAGQVKRASQSDQVSPIQAKKSKSSSKRDRVIQQKEFDNSGVVGALAGLRDTLKETETHK